MSTSETTKVQQSPLPKDVMPALPLGELGFSDPGTGYSYIHHVLTKGPPIGHRPPLRRPRPPPCGGGGRDLAIEMHHQINSWIGSSSTRYCGRPVGSAMVTDDVSMPKVVVERGDDLLHLYRTLGRFLTQSIRSTDRLAGSHSASGQIRTTDSIPVITS